MLTNTVFLVVLAVVFVGGIGVTLVWWGLADRLFPGAARKTGQGVRSRRQPKPRTPPSVVRDFDSPTDSH